MKTRWYIFLAANDTTQSTELIERRSVYWFLQEGYNIRKKLGLHKRVHITRKYVKISINITSKVKS